jgi:hypothetical protein
MTTWVAGNTPAAADLNRWELTYDAVGSTGLRAPFVAASNPVVWLAYPKAAAFTFGTAPVTSAGFVRTMTGNPWGADSISGFAQDDRGAQASTSSGTANTLLTDTRYIFPALAACSVSKVEANVRMAIYGTTAAGQFDKIELQIAVINAAGTETPHATVGINSTVQANTSSNVSNPKVFERFVSADLSASPLALAVGERLSVRVKTYGRASSNTITIQAPADGNELGAAIPTPTRPLPIAVYFA